MFKSSECMLKFMVIERMCTKNKVGVYQWLSKYIQPQRVVEISFLTMIAKKYPRYVVGVMAYPCGVVGKNSQWAN